MTGLQIFGLVLGAFIVICSLFGGGSQGHRSNMDYLDYTPNRNARKRIRRNARKEGINEAVAYYQWNENKRKRRRY